MISRSGKGTEDSSQDVAGDGGTSSRGSRKDDSGRNGDVNDHSASLQRSLDLRIQRQPCSYFSGRTPHCRPSTHDRLIVTNLQCPPKLVAQLPIINVRMA